MQEVKKHNLLFAYLLSIKTNKNDFAVQEVNNLNYSNQLFFEKIDELHEETTHAKTDYLEIYCIVFNSVHKEDIKAEIKDLITTKDFLNYDPHTLDLTSFINKFFENYNANIDTLNHYAEQFKIDDDLSLFAICFFPKSTDFSADFFESSINSWLDGVQIFLYGKQPITFPFYLNSLNNRRIIGNYADKKLAERYLILEGGIRLYLDGYNSYYDHNLGINDFNNLSLIDLNNILVNPCYNFGKHYEPFELYLTWFKVLLYVLAIADIKWNTNNIQNIWRTFIKFIESDVCYFKKVPPIMEEALFYDVLLAHISITRRYLQGSDEVILSKDFFLTLKSFYPFIDTLIHLFPAHLLTKKENKFSLPKYQELLQKITINNNYQKGLNLENVVEYLVNTSSELKLMAKRSHNEREEIDISCCNISKDSCLWDLGAFFYIECKNWQRKVDVKTIRELGYIMLYKGHTVTILITRNGLTKVAEKEIRRLALQEKYLLTFTLEDLNLITNAQDFIQIIKNKYQNLLADIQKEVYLIGV